MKNIVRLPISLLISFGFWPACAPQPKTVANVTIGNTGCPAEDLAIFNYNKENRSWQGACHEKMYVCSDVRGATRCTLQDEATRDAEVFVRAQLLFELPKHKRNAFIEYDVKQGSWDDYSLRVAIVGSLSAIQVDALEGRIDQLYVGVSEEFSQEIADCVGKDEYFAVRYDGIRMNETGLIQHECARPLLGSDELEPLKKREGVEVLIPAGVTNVKPFPRPEVEMTEDELPEPPLEEEEGDETAEEPGSAAAIDPHVADSVRKWLGEHRDDILTCAAKERVAILAELNDEGSVSVSLRGELAGTPEEMCVRSAVGKQVFEAGSGQVLHLIK